MNATFTAPAALVDNNEFGGSLYPTLGRALEAACEQWLGGTTGEAVALTAEMLGDNWLKLDAASQPDDEGAEVEVAAVESAMARVLAAAAARSARARELTEAGHHDDAYLVAAGLAD